MLDMFISSARIYQNIINVDTSIVTQKIMQDTLNKPLECGRGISQTKRHTQPFKRTKRRAKSCFMNITSTYFDLVVAPAQIYFSKIFRTLHLVKQVFGARQRKLVLNSNFI